MEIKIDRAALLKLIEEDPSFTIAIQETVCSEIVRRFFEKDAKRIIAAALPQLTAQAVAALQSKEDTLGWVQEALRTSLVPRTTYGRIELGKDVKEALGREVEAQRLRVISSAASGVLPDLVPQIEAAVAAKLDPDALDQRIAEHVEAFTKAEVDRRVKEALSERVRALNAVLRETA